MGLEQFFEDASSGNLPQVSYIIGPAELSEYPPYRPKDGGWLHRVVVNAITSSPLYKNMVLVVNYDVTGGWGDHVTRFHSPSRTPGEWVEDPYDEFGYVYTVPGYRLPFCIVSPWTRGGNVYDEHADHSSRIKFLEEVFAAKGMNVTTDQIPAWRRANMADLTKAFDFEHPDYSLPSMPNVLCPTRDKSGRWNGYAVCESTYKLQRPPVPYGKQSESTSLVAEEGFKTMRSQMTEGRYLTLEMENYALTNYEGNLTTTKATTQHDSKAQRFVIYQSGTKYSIKSTLNGTSVVGPAAMKKGGSISTFTVTDLGNGQRYTVQAASGQFQSISS